MVPPGSPTPNLSPAWVSDFSLSPAWVSDSQLQPCLGLRLQPLPCLHLTLPASALPGYRLPAPRPERKEQVLFLPRGLGCLYGPTS